MSSKGLEIIDHSAQLTHEWVNELVERLDWSNHKDALRLLRVTLRQVRDHISHDEMAQFSAQLPLLIRGMFYEGWVPKNTPSKDRKLSSFVAAIEETISDVLEYRGTQDIQTVFRLINARISRGETNDVRANLPEEIRELWPEP
ncbi:MAG: DUF2267 domain-containing protein [Litoreibacter sp.]|nr:DUF2267 domain-containing protein [Litoreibacter sp.]